MEARPNLTRFSAIAAIFLLSVGAHMASRHSAWPRSFTWLSTASYVCYAIGAIGGNWLLASRTRLISRAQLLAIVVATLIVTVIVLHVFLAPDLVSFALGSVRELAFGTLLAVIVHLMMSVTDTGRVTGAAAITYCLGYAAQASWFTVQATASLRRAPIPSLYPYVDLLCLLGGAYLVWNAPRPTGDNRAVTHNRKDVSIAVALGILFVVANFRIHSIAHLVLPTHINDFLGPMSFSLVVVMLSTTIAVSIAALAMQAIRHPHDMRHAIGLAGAAILVILMIPTLRTDYSGRLLAVGAAYMVYVGLLIFLLDVSRERRTAIPVLAFFIALTLANHAIVSVTQSVRNPNHNIFFLEGGLATAIATIAICTAAIILLMNLVPPPTDDEPTAEAG